MRTKPGYYYAQSAAIPYRLNRGELEILLITSRKKKRWLVPKGIMEPDLSAWDSAAKEAQEEAGVSGDVSGTSIGTYHYEKWGGTCKVKVFPMRVERVAEDWPEPFRDREWVSVGEAVRRVGEPRLKTLIQGLPRFLAIA
jgi:phosphohistidine phosphatase